MTRQVTFGLDKRSLVQKSARTKNEPELPIGRFLKSKSLGGNWVIVIRSACGVRQMKHDAISSAQPGLVLGHFGLAVLIFLISLPVFALTILAPPWLDVHCQRRQVLYWSERIKTYETSFAGFDFILASQKWNSVKTPPNPGSEQLFDSKEFDVFWPLLITEWVAIIGTAGASYYKLSRRVFQLSRHPKNAEQANALEPAVGSHSNGSSSPPAQ